MSASRPHSIRVERPVVLVVDDDPDARFIYSEYLRAMGCRVFTATDGRAAVNKAESLAPDIVVMDLAMPHLNGFDAIRRLRESSWTRRLRIIAISAVRESEPAAIAAGCDAYQSKPCLPETLWQRIQSLLGIGAAPPQQQ